MNDLGGSVRGDRQHSVVQQDDKVAFYWLEKAASTGHVEAQYAVSMMYREGIGMGRRNETKALEFLRLAADGGHPSAMYAIGVAYAKGEGVIQDFVQGHKWLNLAVVAGSADAPKARDIVTSLMTREQVAEAQKAARQWTKRPKP